MPYRIVLTSSILAHPLNRHILPAIATAARNLGDACSIDVLPPRVVMEPGALDGADMLIFLGSLSDARNPIEQMPELARRAGAISVFWSTEDPYERDFVWRAEEFDHILSNDATTTKLSLFRPDMHHLPLAGSFAHDMRPVRPLADREIDIFFCGAPYQNRRIFIEDMRRAARRQAGGPSIHLAGRQWQDHGEAAAEPDLTHRDLQDLYTHARVVLYLHRSLNIANEQLKLVPTTPGPRLFEAALAGTVQVSEFVSFETERYFEPGRELRTVHSGAEAYEAARVIVQDPDAWFETAVAAQRRAIAEHCYEHRLVRLFDMIRPANLDPSVLSDLKTQCRDLTAQRLASAAP